MNRFIAAGLGLAYSGPEMRSVAPRRSRRRFLRDSLALACLGLAAGCGAVPPWAPPAPTVARVPRIGCLSLGGPSSNFDAHFRRGLAELGYVEGQTILIEWLADEGREERLSENVAQLLALGLDLVVAVGESRARAMRQATATLPIVLSAGVDPVGAGLIESFNRPGGNVTGTIESHPQLHGKQLELLREIAPGIARVTVLAQGGATAASRFDELQAAARTLGLDLRVVRASTAEALADALAGEAGEPPDAVLTLHSGFMYSQRHQVFDFADRKRLPAMYGNRLYAEAGGLAAYGPDLLAIHHRAATYVDKILKGAKPAELSVELPTTFDFVINLKAAQVLGRNIPPSVLAQATEIIQ